MINTERLNLMIPSSSHLIELYNICSHPQANIYTPKGLHNSKLDTQRWIEKWQKPLATISIWLLCIGEKNRL